MSITEQDVTIQLRHELDERGEYNEMTAIDVGILVRGQAAGKIHGTIVNRQSIPARCFYSAMDAHSADLQYVAVNLFEPRRGRTKLQSLRGQGDDDEFDFLYIESLIVNEEFRTNGYSDVGTYALRKLLYHPFIRGDDEDFWQTSSCIYILANTTPEDKNYAIQFLRNGFFQDNAVVREGGDRFLVAAYGDWEAPLKSYARAAAIPFLEAPPKQAPPTGKDAEIKQIINRMCALRNISDTGCLADIARLTSQGGSLARARALHVAVAHGFKPMAEFIIRADPSTLEIQDEMGITPLMVAAASAAGSANNMGIPGDQPVIDCLLAAGARKDIVDSKGMTAYGNLLQAHNAFSEAMQAMMGGPVRGGSDNTPGLAELKAKLMPPGGPTAADLRGGATEGFVDYSQEDAEDDPMYDSDEDD